MVGGLPNELWMMIVDTLGLQGYTRDCTNLIKATGLSESLVYNYLVSELFKMRHTGWIYDNSKGKDGYYKQMLDFWKRTGIDDGLSSKDLLSNLNSHTKMYKTIWSYSVFKNTKGYKCVYRNIIFDSLYSNHNLEYTDFIFKDDRIIDIYTLCSFCDLSENSKKEIDNTIENLNNCKKITYDKYKIYDRDKQLLLYKAKGTLI